MTEVGKLIREYDTILAGLGTEWRADRNRDIIGVYNTLYEMLKYKNFFVVTMATDAVIFDSGFGRSDGFLPPAHQIVAPCGNETWRQCSETCTKDIWEPGEIADGRCPHCGAALTGNTIAAGQYIEEGYLPQWNRYMQWLSSTVGKPMLLLELGVDSLLPAVIRRPFEKTVMFNQKARLIRVGDKNSHFSDDIAGRCDSIQGNSVEFVRNLRA